MSDLCCGVSTVRLACALSFLLWHLCGQLSVLWHFCRGTCRVFVVREFGSTPCFSLAPISAWHSLYVAKYACSCGGACVAVVASMAPICLVQYAELGDVLFDAGFHVESDRKHVEKLDGLITSLSVKSGHKTYISKN
jgi:hypothetical protein